MSGWGTQFGGILVGKPIAKTESSNWGSQFGGIPVGGSSERGLGASALRQVGRLGRAAATGITGIADIPNLAAMGLHAAGLKETPTFYEPLAGKIQQSIDSLTSGSLKPENKTEEYVDMISEGLAPMALTGGSSLTGSAARGLSKTGAKIPTKIAQATLASPEPTIANIAQSVGSSAALQAYLDEGGDPGLVGPLLAGMAGGVGARGTLAVAKNVPKLKNPLNAVAEGIGRATLFNPEKYAQNIELGLPVSLGSVSNSMIPNYVELSAAKMPGSMGPLDKFHQRREAAIARNLGVSFPEDLEKTVSGSKKHLAKEGAKGYHKNASDTFESHNENFKPREEKAIKNKETIDVSDYIQELENERERRVSPAAKAEWDAKNKDGILLKKLKEYSEPSEKQLQANFIRQELQKISVPEKEIQKIIKTNLGEIPPSKTNIGLEDLNDLRKTALDESKTLKAPLGEGTTESRSASIRHGKLSEKRQQFIEEVGTPTEVYHAREARKFWSQYKNEENGLAKYVAKITGADSDAQAFEKLTSKDPKYLRVVRQGLDKETKLQLDHSIMEELGSRQGRFNINTAHTNFTRKGYEDFAREYLKGLPSKAARNNFKNTMNLIGKDKRMMEKLANTSGTAHTKQIINEIKKYGSAAIITITKADPKVLLGLILTNASLNAGAKIWTSQKFLRRVNDVIKTNSNMGKANKLDMLLKTIEQVGTHTKHMDDSEAQKYAKGGNVKRSKFPQGGYVSSSDSTSESSSPELTPKKFPQRRTSPQPPELSLSPSSMTIHPQYGGLSLPSSRFSRSSWPTYSPPSGPISSSSSSLVPSSTGAPQMNIPQRVVQPATGAYVPVTTSGMGFQHIPPIVPPLAPSQLAGMMPPLSLPAAVNPPLPNTAVRLPYPHVRQGKHTTGCTDASVLSYLKSINHPSVKNMNPDETGIEQFHNNVVSPYFETVKSGYRETPLRNYKETQKESASNTSSARMKKDYRNSVQFAANNYLKTGKVFPSDALEAAGAGTVSPFEHRSVTTSTGEFGEEEAPSPRRLQTYEQDAKQPFFITMNYPDKKSSHTVLGSNIRETKPGKWFMDINDPMHTGVQTLPYNHKSNKPFGGILAGSGLSALDRIYGIVPLPEPRPIAVRGQPVPQLSPRHYVQPHPSMIPSYSIAEARKMLKDHPEEFKKYYKDNPSSFPSPSSFGYNISNKRRKN